MARNMETLCMLKMTFFGKHQPPPQHLEEAPEGRPHGQIQAQDPAEINVITVTKCCSSIVRLTIQEGKSYVLAWKSC